jgi:hypothetical protein
MSAALHAISAPIGLVGKKSTAPKAQTHDGYDEDVFAGERSPCQKMAGFLKKQNSKGVWQKRYFLLNNGHLVYKVNEGPLVAMDSETGNVANVGKDGRIKGAISLLGVAQFTSSEDDGGDPCCLGLVMEGLKERLDLKAETATEAKAWISALIERRRWARSDVSELREAAEMAGVNRGSLQSQANVSVEREGWLQKRSHSKYKGLQVRDVSPQKSRALFLHLRGHDPCQRLNATLVLTNSYSSTLKLTQNHSKTLQKRSETFQIMHLPLIIICGTIWVANIPITGSMGQCG